MNRMNRINVSNRLNNKFMLKKAVSLAVAMIISGALIITGGACAAPSSVASEAAAVTVSVFNLSATSVTLSWSTGKPANTEVEYWKSGTNDKKNIKQEALSTHHQVDILSIEPGVTYYYRVKSADSENKVIAQKDGMFLLGNAAIGKSAPDFTLTSLDGKTVTLNDFRGKAVLLDFWIYTCTGCKEKLKLLQDAYSKMAGKVEILCIHPKEKEPLIRSFLEADSLSVPVFIDNEGSVIKFYKVTGFPTTFFIDEKGVLRLIDKEFTTVEELQDIFNSMVADQAK
jgi:peroxiredoxin